MKPFCRVFSPLVVGVIVSSATHAAPPPALTLRLKFKKNEVSRYQTVADVTSSVPNESSHASKTSSKGAQPGKNVIITSRAPMVNSVAINVLQQMGVQQVLPKGGADVIVTTLSGDVTTNKGQATPPDRNPIMVRYDAQGNITSMRIAAREQNTDFLGGLIGSGALGFQRAYLPSKPVHIGDSWTQLVSLPGWKGQGKATAKLLRIEKVGRYQTARITAGFTMPIQVFLNNKLQPIPTPKGATSELAGDLTMRFETNFAIEEGKMIRTSGRGTGTFHIQPTQSASAHKAEAKSLSSLEFHLEISVGSSIVE